MSRPASRAAPLLLVLLTALVFAPSLLGGFLDWDDPINFLENPYYRGQPAIGAFERAITVHPRDPVARLGLARAYAAHGDRAAARQQLAALRSLDPRLAAQVEQEFR